MNFIVSGPPPVEEYVKVYTTLRTKNKNMT